MSGLNLQPSSSPPNRSAAASTYKEAVNDGGGEVAQPRGIWSKEKVESRTLTNLPELSILGRSCSIFWTKRVLS